MPRVAVRIWIAGRVQGVGFRWWTMRQAEGLGLDGWVRNRADGRVEVLVIGDEAVVSRFVILCAEGPAGAAVRAVSPEPAGDDGSAGFGQRPTA